MKIKLSPIEKCNGCGACMNACPKGAIKMQKDADGFLYPYIDEKSCIECTLCMKSCPELQVHSTLTLAEQNPAPAAFYGWHKDPLVRQGSSSGGFFSALADYVLAQGGVVFGAVYDAKEHQVCHASSDEYKLDDIRKSKYVQSNMGYAYRNAKSELDKGRLVLFCGTPCQVSGLKLFLNKHYDNLISCDFICHGVPPMQLLNDHLNILGKQYHSSVKAIDFRPKINGWNQHHFQCLFENGKRYLKQYLFDSYFNAFSSNYILRKSCYSCPYASGADRAADFTIADFWGYVYSLPTINPDNLGISLVVVNNMANIDLMAKLDNWENHAMPLEYALYAYHDKNPKLYNPAKREEFFTIYRKLGYRKAIARMKLNPSMKLRLKELVKSLLKRAKLR